MQEHALKIRAERRQAMLVGTSDFTMMLHDLMRVQAFPSSASAHEPITLIQTHASAVILTHEYVYKIKKPKNFGFFDYSTPALRRFFCQQEVRLNAPFAPGIYLGIAPIVSLPSGHVCFGSPLSLDTIPLPGAWYAGGSVIDFAVVMKRLPDSATLEARIQADTVDAPTLVALAHFVAAFHATSPAEKQIAQFGNLDIIQANWEENFRQMRPYVGRVLDSKAYEQIAAYVHAFLKNRPALFAERIKCGHIRDCHGDLRLQHIYLLDRVADTTNQLPPFALLDRIEFNERFRYGDVASEIAFLTMEMEAAGRADLAHLFTQAYHAATDDDILQELLPFYQCYRACVRGKVQSFLLDDTGVSPQQRLAAEQQARALFALAAHYAHTPVQPTIIMIGGLMGTGKSTLARTLQQALGWALFSSDEVRKQLAQIDPTYPQAEAFGQGIYEPGWTKRTYQTLYQKTRETLVHDRSVLLDASFLRKAHRQALAQEAVARNVSVVFLECRCEQETALKRLETRWQKHLKGLQATTEASSASDGRPALYEAQKATWEAVQPDEIPGMKHTIINTALPLAHCIEQVLEACCISRLTCWLS
jgi:aminoglycoside phosphotransferase family enzyme/predicted kinase